LSESIKSIKCVDCFNKREVPTWDRGWEELERRWGRGWYHDYCHFPQGYQCLVKGRL